MRTPIADTATSEALLGRWALVYASEDPTRSSPFFWAFRCVLCFSSLSPKLRSFGGCSSLEGWVFWGRQTNRVLCSLRHRHQELRQRQQQQQHG